MSDANVEQATEAISGLSVENDQDATAAPSVELEDESQKPRNFVKFFVGDITAGSTEDSIRAYFQQFGAVERVVVKHSFNDKQRSFAFVTIDGDADKIMKTSHVIDGHTVAAPEFARSNGGSSNGFNSSGRQQGRGGRDAARSSLKGSRKIFVGGLSHQTHEAALRAHFEKFGKLTDVVVMHEAGGRKPRGFGFVTFADCSAVQKVLQSRFHPVDGRGVEVKLAIPRELMHDEADAAAEHKGYRSDMYPEYGMQYGDYITADQTDYPISGYMPSIPYGYMPNMPVPMQPMSGNGREAYGSQPAQGIRILYGTQPTMPQSKGGDYDQSGQQHARSYSSRRASGSSAGGNFQAAPHHQANYIAGHSKSSPTPNAVASPASAPVMGQSSVVGPHPNPPGPIRQVPAGGQMPLPMAPMHMGQPMMMSPMVPYPNTGAAPPLPHPAGYLVPTPAPPGYA